MKHKVHIRNGIAYLARWEKRDDGIYTIIAGGKKLAEPKKLSKEEIKTHYLLPDSWKYA